MASQTDIVSQMRAALAATDPNLDTSVGTTTRKILDTVAESIAEAYIENHVLAYQYDVDSKTDADLDDFTQLFGIARYGAKRASGTVIFSRGNGDAATRPLLVPVATQVGSTTVPQVVVATIAPAVLDVGVQSVSVPVQAVVGGPEGNVGAGLLTRIIQPLDSISAVTNIEALTGGAERESDTQLRLRWKRTVFRSLAGTEQMYLGVALNDGIANPDAGCTQANVVGASKRFRSKVQISGGVAVSEIDDARYVYPNSSVVGEDIDGGDLAIRGLDYTFDHTNVEGGRIAPKITNNGGLTEGEIYDLDFEYGPIATRNNPAAGITNRVDVWCNGVRPVEVVQTVLFKSDAAYRFSDDATNPYHRLRFRRLNDAPPQANNIFVPLAWGPIVTVPSSIIVGGVTYGPGQFFVVHDDTAFGYTPTSLFGLELSVSAQPDIPPNNSIFTLTYTYNEVPRSIQTAIDNWRLVGIDAKAHQAKLQRLHINLAVMYSPRADRAQTDTLIATEISKFLDRSPFNSTVQASDILDVIHNLAGVDNVRFLNASDYPGYSPVNPSASGVGIQRRVNGQTVESYVDPATGRVQDKTFGDNELPVFDSLNIVVKAQNTFGTF